MRKTFLRLCGNFRNTPSSLVKGRVWLRRDVTCSEVGLLIMTVKCFFFLSPFSAHYYLQNYFVYKNIDIF